MYSETVDDGARMVCLEELHEIGEIKELSASSPTSESLPLPALASFGGGVIVLIKLGSRRGFPEI